jgi:hypothetical protein
LERVPREYAKGGGVGDWRFKPNDEGWLEGVGYIKILQLLDADESYSQPRYYYQIVDKKKNAWTYKDKFEKSDEFAFTPVEDLDADWLKDVRSTYAKGGGVDEKPTKSDYDGWKKSVESDDVPASVKKSLKKLITKWKSEFEGGNKPSSKKGDSKKDDKKEDKEKGSGLWIDTGKKGGTKGVKADSKNSFRDEAEKRDMTSGTLAKKVLANPNRYKDINPKSAQLVVNMGVKKRGGEIRGRKANIDERLLRRRGN